MAANKEDPLLRTASLDELVEFFETHDMGEVWEQMPAADFDIDILKRKHLVALDDDLAGKVGEPSPAGGDTAVAKKVWNRQKR